MEVLNLATSDKQDEILSNFPISGGTDFKSMQAHFLLKRGLNPTILPVLSIEGSGILTSLLNISTSERPVNILVDGVPMSGDDIGYLVGSKFEINSLIPFNISLEITTGHETFVEDFKCSYLLD